MSAFTSSDCRAITMFVDRMRDLCKPPDIGNHDMSITLAQIKTLEIVSINQPEGILQKEIVHMLGLSAGAVSKTIDQLVRAGLVERSVPENDRRAVRIRLSKFGEELEAFHARSFMKWIELWMKNVSEADRVAFFRVIRHLCDSATQQVIARN